MAIEDENSNLQPEQAQAAIPEFCIRDGSIMEDGERFGFPAWVCPMCTYWKIKPTS